MWHRITFYLGIVFWMVAAGVQAISLSQSLDKTEIAYDDHATLEIVVTWPGAQTSYIFDKPLQPQMENLKVQQYSSTTGSITTGGGEVTTKRFSFTLVPVGSGTGRIAPVTVSYFSWPDSIPGQLVTEEMTLRIAPPVAKKSPGGLSKMPLGIWIAGGAGWLLILGVIGLVIVKRRRPKQVVKTPRDLFLERLTLLKQASGSDLKRFQTGLYRDLTWYLSTAYGMDPVGLSLDEILTSVDGSKIPEIEKDKICGWLARADREKFSPLPPSPGETMRLEHEVREFFEKMNVSS
jgi:hypothetical protein